MVDHVFYRDYLCYLSTRKEWKIGRRGLLLNIAGEQPSLYPVRVKTYPPSHHYEDARNSVTQYDLLQDEYNGFYFRRKPWKRGSDAHAIAQGRMLGYRVDTL